MSERPDRMSPKPEYNEDELRWAAQHLPQIRGWISGRRFLYDAMVTAVVLGLIARVAGYLLGVSGSGEPRGLVADLLSNLGMALWIGAVLVVFVQVLPDYQRRTALRLIEQSEALLQVKDRSPDKET
jgi:hypothetical protein